MQLNKLSCEHLEAKLSCTAEWVLVPRGVRSHFSVSTISNSTGSCKLLLQGSLYRGLPFGSVKVSNDPQNSIQNEPQDMQSVPCSPRV